MYYNQSYFPQDMPRTRLLYNGMCSALDESVANITSTLTTAGVMNNTIIVFISDNGGNIGTGTVRLGSVLILMSLLRSMRVTLTRSIPTKLADRCNLQALHGGIPKVEVTIFRFGVVSSVFLKGEFGYQHSCTPRACSQHPHLDKCSHQRFMSATGA